MKDYSKYLLSEKANVKEALLALNALSSDTLNLFIVDEAGKVLGSVTDGDVRRNLINGTQLEDKISMVMNTQFYFIYEDDFCVQKIKELKAENIPLLPVLDAKGRITSILNLKKKKSILPLDVVLMAGGKGERLRPLTEKTPKPLLKIGDKPIIDYNVDRLIEYGIENINVTINYLGEQIEKHFEEKREDIFVKCVKEPKYLGTIGSIKFVESFKHNNLLVMNSDLFTNINYEDFFLHFEKSGADMSVVTIPYSVSIPYGIFEFSEQNIVGIKEKPTYNYYANAGIYLIKKELLKMIPEDTFFNATDLINLLMKNNYKVIRFPHTGYWIDIGKLEDYNKAQEFAKHI